MDRSPPPPASEQLLAAAQGGSDQAIGLLLESCRNYLLLVAHRELGPQCRAKVGASDLVQDTFAEAHRSFPSFRGHTERHLLSWLRGILLNNLCDLTRRYQAACRHVAQEVPLSDSGRHGASATALAAPASAPDEQLIAQERSQALAAALEGLPETYRQVLRLRYDEKNSFEEIGKALGRTAEAARKLWFRAVECLRSKMGVSDDGQRGG